MMKQVGHLLFFLLIAGCAVAQDIIVRKDGTIIRGKVVEISERAVKYRSPDAQGPVHSVPVTELTSINFENGKIERFNFSNGATADAGRVEKLKKRIEILAKEAGDKIMASCARPGITVDNYHTEIYWDAVTDLTSGGDITVPIITKWISTYTGEDGDWIKGKLVLSNNTRDIKWVYLNRSDHADDCGEILSFN